MYFSGKAAGIGVDGPVVHISVGMYKFHTLVTRSTLLCKSDKPSCKQEGCHYEYAHKAAFH